MSDNRKIVSGRATLATESRGSGDPVVFLHAAICDSRMWRAQLDAVGASHKAIAYDRRGFGRTHAEKEDHSAVADLRAVIDAAAQGAPAILVACSQGGRIALDMALQYPHYVRALILISPSVSGAPDPVYPPDIKALMGTLKEAESRGDLDQVNAMKARLFLDGPLQPEGRVDGAVRRLFLDMNGIALRTPPVGASLDAAPAYPRLGEITAPSLVICGDFDFPHIRERSHQMAMAMPNASFQGLPGTAHLPALDQPAALTGLISSFITHRSGQE